VWATWCALAALAWSSLGILPSIGLTIASSRYAMADRHDAHAEGGAVSHHPHGAGSGHESHGGHSDFSDIPGSPTHPIDHDCFACQVLTHLSRCLVDAPCVSTLEVPPGRHIRPDSAVATRVPREVARVPPARGPPLHNA